MAQSKTILITGANRGIGLAFARQLLTRGDRVAGDVSRSKKSGRVEEADQSPSRSVLIVPMAVAEENSIRSAREAIKPHAKLIDLLINNAGVYGSQGRRGRPTDGEDRRN